MDLLMWTHMDMYR